MNINHNAIIIGISSDIGYELAKRYSELKYTIVGTYRSQSYLQKISELSDCHYYHCDISKITDIEAFKDFFSSLNKKWDLFISSVGTQKPIYNFFDCDFDEWSESIHTNAIEQLRVLHELYPYRDKDKIVDVVFFAGSGTNGPAPNYSAYTVSKIMLIKMCELLDSEYADINIFIVGPGWVRTKIHQETLDNKKGAGNNYYRTLKFVNGGIPATSEDDIFDCIEWLRSKGRKVVGGRNFSVVYDKWGGDKNGNILAQALLNDGDMYKLRRHGNGDIK